jgi:hypothetical protein
MRIDKWYKRQRNVESRKLSNKNLFLFSFLRRWLDLLAYLNYGSWAATDLMIFHFIERAIVKTIKLLFFVFFHQKSILASLNLMFGQNLIKSYEHFFSIDWVMINKRRYQQSNNWKMKWWKFLGPPTSINQVVSLCMNGVRCLFNKKTPYFEIIDFLKKFFSLLKINATNTQIISIFSLILQMNSMQQMKVFRGNDF